MVVSLEAARPGASYSTLAWHHILFSLAAILNFVIMTVYWTMIHSEHITKPEIIAFPHKVILAYVDHTVPGLALLYVFCKQDVILRAKDSVLLLPIGLAYAYSNYKGTIKQGSPIYWFLTWEDWRSGFVALAILVISVTFYVALSLLTVCIKRKGKHRHNKKL